MKAGYCACSGCLAKISANLEKCRCPGCVDRNFPDVHPRLRLCIVDIFEVCAANSYWPIKPMKPRHIQAVEKENKKSKV